MATLVIKPQRVLFPSWAKTSPDEAKNHFVTHHYSLSNPESIEHAGRALWLAQLKDKQAKLQVCQCGKGLVLVL